MVRLLLSLLGACLMLVGALLPCLGASVSASLDRAIAESGETLRLNVTLEGEQPTAVPRLPNLPLVQSIQYLGPRQMTQIVNGVSSFQVVFQFQLQTRGEGELTVPALTVATRAGSLQTEPVSCRITPREPKNDRVTLKIVTPRDECYVGQTLPYDLQLYSSVNLNQIAPPKMSFDGFVTGQEMPPSNTQTVRDGQAFIVLSYRHTATPTKEGVLSLGRPPRSTCWRSTGAAGRAACSTTSSGGAPNWSGARPRRRHGRSGSRPSPPRGAPRGFPGRSGASPSVRSPPGPTSRSARPSP